LRPVVSQEFRKSGMDLRRSGTIPLLSRSRASLLTGRPGPRGSPAPTPTRATSSVPSTPQSTVNAPPEGPSVAQTFWLQQASLRNAGKTILVSRMQNHNASSRCFESPCISQNALDSAAPVAPLPQNALQMVWHKVREMQSSQRPSHDMFRRPLSNRRTPHASRRPRLGSSLLR